jgi:hypothetical protein
MGNYGSPDYGSPDYGNYGMSGPTTVQATPMHSAPAGAGEVWQKETFPGYISAYDLEGCWACVCVPLGWACFKKEAQGPDSLLLHGLCFVCCVIPCPFRDMRHRVPGTNGFHKEGEPDDVDHHWSRSCDCNGPSCSIRLC